MMKSLHVIFIIATLIVVAYADEEALQYMLGKKRLTLDTVRALHYLVAFGLAGTIVTGGLLYLRAPSAYLDNPTFIAKMVAVAALIVNSAFLDRFSVDAVTRPWTSLAPREKRMLLISGGVSVLGWATAGVCGLMMTYHL
jgi:hypothetical protein